MREPKSRPITWTDLLILIAVVAGVFVVQRGIEVPPKRPDYLAGSYVVYGPVRDARWLDRLWYPAATSQAFAVTLALVILRWREPRPHWRRIARQPGAMACLAVVVAVGCGVVLYRIELDLGVIQPLDWMVARFQPDKSALRDIAVGWGASGVAGAWGMLILRGRWRPEATWIDRAGRVMGCYWLIGALIGLLLWPIMPVRDPPWIMPTP